MEKCLNGNSAKEQNHDAFVNELKIFHRNRGSPFRTIPKINGREIHLLKFYDAVTNAGGFKIVTEQRKWSDVAKILKFPRGCVNISLSLRKIYIRYLKHYEKIHFMKKQINENLTVESQIKKFKYCQDVPMMYDVAQHTVSDASRSTLGLNETFVSPNYYIKLCMSLLCGLPNEQELALNICIFLSHKENFCFDLNQAPKLIDFVVAQAGVWNPDDCALKTLCLESWKNVKGRSMACFWQSVLDVRNEELAQFLGSNLNEHNPDESLLNIKQGIWCPSSESEIVFKVAVILYNLSFEKCNKSVLVSNRNLLRFLLFCIHSSSGTLKQTAYDSLGNLAIELKISVEQDIYSRIIFQTVVNGIHSCDRYIIIRSIDILSQLCCCEANEDIITSLLNTEVYHQLLLLLTVNDVVLLTHSLDALYALSDLGKYPCDKIASRHHFINTLVSLLTCESNKFEPSAFINMKLVKTLYPIELDVDKEVISTSSETLKAAPNSVGTENIACKWLKDNYEIGQNCSCSHDEIFSHYISFCNKSSFKQANIILFRTCVKTTFPECRLKILKSKSDVKKYHFYGLKRKSFSLPDSELSETLNLSHSLSSFSHSSFLLDKPINDIKNLEKQEDPPFNSLSENQRFATAEQNIKLNIEKLNMSPVVRITKLLPECLTYSKSPTPRENTPQKTVPHSFFPSNAQKMVMCSPNKMFSNDNAISTDMQYVKVDEIVKCDDIIIPVQASSTPQKQVSIIPSKGFGSNLKMNTNEILSTSSTTNDSASVKHRNLSNIISEAVCPQNAFLNSESFNSTNSLIGVNSNDGNSLNTQYSEASTKTEKIILMAKSSQKPLSNATESFDQISSDRHNLSIKANSFENRATKDQQLITSDISSPSIFRSSLLDQNHKDYSSSKVMEKRCDNLILKSPLLSSILNKESILTTKNLSDPVTQNGLTSRNCNIKIISNVVLEPTCFKVLPVSSLNTTFTSASHPNLESASSPSQKIITKVSAENSILDVLPSVPACIENSNNTSFIKVLPSAPCEMKLGENNIVIVKHHVDSAKDSAHKSDQSSQQVLDNLSSNCVVSNQTTKAFDKIHQQHIKTVSHQQIDGRISATTNHILNNFSKDKEPICRVADAISPNKVPHLITRDSSVTSNSCNNLMIESLVSPLHEMKKNCSSVDFCAIKVNKNIQSVSSFTNFRDRNNELVSTSSSFEPSGTFLFNETEKGKASEPVSYKHTSIFTPCKASPTLKEFKAHDILNVPSEKIKYSCEWKDCGLKFPKISSMYLHISQVHVPTNNDDMLCLWNGCGPLKRKRMSLLTHVQDWHCNETSLKSQSLRKLKTTQEGKTAIPPPQSVYASDAAIIAIKRRALQDIDPNRQFSKKKSGNEKEQALEESIRLTSALILRNLVSYSPTARTYIRRFEPELVHLAMSQTESSNILAQCLSYLT